VAQAFHFLKDNEGLIEKDQIRLTMIPAPPFGEEARGRAFADELRQSGFSPATDEIGNIVSPYSEAARIRRAGRTPRYGISWRRSSKTPKEWTRDLSSRLVGQRRRSGCRAMVFRAALHAGLRFRRPVIVVGNVGEEGEGNLRGVRRLFQISAVGDKACDFIAVDGAGLQRITHQALSRIRRDRCFGVHMHRSMR